jgi:hypothetical protein
MFQMGFKNLGGDRHAVGQHGTEAVIGKDGGPMLSCPGRIYQWRNRQKIQHSEEENKDYCLLGHDYYSYRQEYFPNSPICYDAEELLAIF